jgi:O-antigen/teichoic acid export membrane protein
MVFSVLMFPACILFGLTELLIPELARCKAAGSKGRIRYLVRRSLRLALIYGTVCGGILYLCSHDLSMRLYKNTQAGEYLQWFSLLAPMLYCDIVTDAMIKGLGQQKISVCYNIFTSALDLVLLFFLLPKYGIQGYFFSFALTHAINFFLSLRRLLKTTGQKLPVHTGVITGGCAIGSIWAAHWVSSSPIGALAFLMIFFSMLVLMKVVSKGDLLWIRGLIRIRR